MHYKKLDLSIGDPLRPMTKIAELAFQSAAPVMHRYINNPASTGWKADPALMQAQDSFRDFLKSEGWQRPGWSGVGNDCFTFLDGGTTRAYDLILHMIARDVEKTNAGRKKRDQIKPVVLAPVPTYGFFLDTPKLYGMDVVTVDRDIRNNGQLDIEKLKQTIRDCFDKNMRIVAYYDCTPHNPLGFVRSAAETETVFKIMTAVRRHYNEADRNIKTGKPYTLGGIKMTPHCNKLRDYPLLIDDLVYHGLQYDARKTVAAFAKQENGLKHTVTLMGPSKAGLAGLRAGIVVGDPEKIDKVKNILKTQAYFPSYTTLAAVEHFYAAKGAGADIKNRHMKTMNADHRFNGLLMKAMINGIDTMPELRPCDRRKIIHTVCRHYRLTGAQALDTMLKPLKGAKIITTPEAGFFHLIDFSQSIRKCHDDTLRIRLCEEFNVQMVPIGWASKTREEDINRITFALPRAQIFEFVDRLRRCSAEFYAEYEPATARAPVRPTRSPALPAMPQ